MNEALRDWVTNVRDTFYVIGSVAGPAPYPAMVRDFQAVIGAETIAQVRERFGHLARRGRGLRRRRLQRHGHLPRLPRPRLGAPDRRRGGRRGPRRPPRRAARQGLAGRAARLVQLPAAGRLGPGRRGALGLGRPGLPGRRARALVAQGLGPGRLRGRDRRGGARGLPHARASSRASSRRSRAPTPWPTCCAARRPVGHVCASRLETGATVRRGTRSTPARHALRAAGTWSSSTSPGGATRTSTRRPRLLETSGMSRRRRALAPRWRARSRRRARGARRSSPT